MPKEKVPPLMLLPEEWKNPTPKALAPPPVLPQPQDEPAIPLVPIVVPPLAPHVYVPVEQPPREPEPEPPTPQPTPPNFPPIPPLPPFPAR